MKYGAFVVGAALGAAFALLCAPASGLSTRKKLGRRVRDSQKRANEALESGRELVTSAIDEGRERWQAAKELPSS